MIENAKKIDRVSIWAVCITGFLIIIGGVIQLRSYLFIHERTIFADIREQLLQAQQQEENASQLAEGSEESQNLAQLQSQDSDKDGLNDFQEQYVYSTSPYLADSDSDNISDMDEITNGTNPNCPEGTTCQVERTEGTDMATDAERAFADLNTENLLPIDENGTVDTTALRSKLQEYGVPAETLQGMTDEQLLTLLQQVVTKQDGTVVTQGGGVESVKQYAETMRNMTIAEKRNFLIESGVKKEELDKLSDEEINSVLNQLIDQTLQEQGIENTALPNDENSTVLDENTKE